MTDVLEQPKPAVASGPAAPQSDIIAILNRKEQPHEKITPGFLQVYKGADLLLEVATLELPWKENEFRVSCIPEGAYWCEYRYSDRFGWHWVVLAVEGRSLILIHSGNFYYQTKGCILPGLTHADIDADGVLDVTNSRKAMQILRGVLPNRFPLYILA
jgi:hypothetical protein